MTLKDFNFKVGFAIKYPIPTNQNYISKFITDARSITSENEFKMGNLQYEKDKFNFTKADQIRDFAIQHNLRLHGHTLIWAHDQSTPDWVKAIEGTPNAVQELTRVLQNHITTVVTHFKGVVKSWDVVNETLYPNATGTNGGGTFRESVWSRVLGRDFFRLAFAAAAAADPDCMLFYNDVNLETGNENAFNSIMEFKNELNAAGVPFHGVGFQMHTFLNQNKDVIRERLRQYAKAGFLVHISELDVTTKSNNTDTVYTAEKERKLAQFYRDIFEDYQKAVPEDKQWGITMWSVSDGDNYMNIPDSGQYPMLFDANLNPKLAYYRVLSLLNQPAETPLVYQDFEYPDVNTVQTPGTIIGDSTGGSTPKTWLLEGPNASARVHIDETGVSGVQNSQNTFNYPLLDTGIANYVLESEAGKVLDSDTMTRVMYLLFRYENANGYLAVQAQKTATTDYWRLIKRNGTQDTALIQTSVKPASEQVIKVVCNGTAISLYINGIFQGKVNETDFLGATKVGYKMRGYDDKFSSWKFIRVSELPKVMDEFQADSRGNINGTSTNGGTVPKTWTVTASGTGNNGMEVTAGGLKAIAGSSIKYNNATVDLGTANFRLSAMLAHTLDGYSDQRNALLIFRVKDIANYYYLKVNNTLSDRKWVLVRRVNDSDTVLLNSPLEAKDGDVVKVLTSGASVGIYVNDYFLGNVTDTNFATQTKVGFRGRGANDTESAWANIQVDY